MGPGRVRERTGQGLWRRGLLAVLLALTGCAVGPDSGPGEAPTARTSLSSARALGVTTRTVTLEPVADATVDATQPDTPLGAQRKLVVDGVPLRRTYLRFKPGTFEGTVTHAVLRLYAVDPSVQGPALYQTGSQWDEATLTWNSAPEMVRTTFPTPGRVPDESWVEYNVTWYVQRGGEAFVLATSSRDGVDFVSRDSPDKAHRPQLVITWAPPFCDPGSAPSVLSLSPTLDTWVEQANPDVGHGSSPELRVEWQPRSEAFLFFDVNTGGQPIVGSRLRLFPTQRPGTAAGMYRVNSAWTGEDFGWVSRPTYDSFGSVTFNDGLSARSWVELGLSSTWWVEAEGRHGFTLTPREPKGSPEYDVLSIVSSEGDEAHRPRLMVGTGVQSCSYRGDGIAGTTEWWKGVGGSGQEVLRAAATTGSGEPVLAGTWSGVGSTWGGATLPDGGGLALARYHTDGTVAWSRGFPARDVGVQGVAVTYPYEKDHNIVVLGDYDGPVDFGTGPLPAEAPGARKLFIAKFNPEGAPLWSRAFTAWREVDGQRLPADVYPRAIEMYVYTDDVFVTGFFTGTLDLGGGPLVASAGDGLTPGMFVAKFTPDGQHVWSRAIPGVEGRPTQGLALAIMYNSDVLVGGTLAASTDLGPEVPPASASRPFVARFSGQTGAPLGNQILDEATGKVQGLVALSDGVLATGRFQGRVLGADGTVAQSEDPNGFLARFVGWPSREPRWFRTFGTAGVDDEGRKLVLANDTVLLTGSLGAETPDFRYLGGLTAGPFIAGFSIDGAALWARNLGWNAPTQVLAPMEDGTVLVGGSIHEPARVDGQTYTPVGDSDLLLMKLRR